MTTPHPDPDLARMLAAVTAAWPDAQTPQPLREACLAFVTDEATKAHVATLRGILLVTIGIWIIDLAEQLGHDRRVLEQVAAAELQTCIAMLMRDVRERAGETYVPARQAIVAWAMAENIARSEPFRFELDAAVAHYKAAVREPADAEIMEGT